MKNYILELRNHVIKIEIKLKKITPAMCATLYRQLFHRDFAHVFFCHDV